MPNSPFRNRAGAPPPPPVSANKLVRGTPLQSVLSSETLPTPATRDVGSGVGPPGPPGTPGAPGAPGAVWYAGAGAPSGGTGINGDFYLNETNGDVYTKSLGSWTIIANIRGPAGANGTNGTNGTNGVNGSTWSSGSGVPSGGTGVNGDYYFRTSNGDVYLKTAGTWSVIANITGPAGATGATGPAGPGVGLRTRSDLRAYTPLADKQFINEEGYSFEGDGGGGLWFFVLSDNYSTDNDGTLVVPGGSRGTAATVGCWHRVGPGTQGNSIIPSTTLDVRWFGAIPDQNNDVTPGVTHAFNALNFASAQQTGCLYFPSGFYRFTTKCVLDMAGNNGNLQIKGDGPASTVFNYGFSAADTCMMEIKNGAKMSMQGISTEWRDYSPPTVGSTRVFWIHDFGAAVITDIYGYGLKGHFLALSTIGQISVSNCITGNLEGSQLAIGLDGASTGCGGIVTNCAFGTGGLTTPALWVGACNSLKIGDCFFAGGGPWKSLSGATITSTGSDFTITSTAHGFHAGEYCLLTGASHAGYNTRWRIDSVTANTITILFTANLGSDTVVLQTLWSCGLLGGQTGGLITESSLDHILFNTGGNPGVGSIGLFLDGRQLNGVKGIQMSELLMDYGYTALFIHGDTALETTGGFEITNVSPNGGPRDDFGAIRFEGTADITMVGGHCFPGNVALAGSTFYSIVICDGAQSGETKDIRITGTVATIKASSDLYSTSTFYAFLFDGAKVKRVSGVNLGIDTVSGNANVASFINSAAASNGITLMYADGVGRVQLLDSTGTHAL